LAANGVPGVELPIELTIRGTTSEPVVISDVRLQLVETAQSDAAWFAVLDPGCGAIDARRIYIELDDPALPVVWRDENSHPIDPHPLLRVDTTDIEVLNVIAESRTRNATFRIVLSWEFHGLTGELLIDDHGKPFRVAGIQPNSEYYEATVALIHRPELDGETVVC
jgi:hypothetical protein